MKTFKRRALAESDALFEEEFYCLEGLDPAHPAVKAVSTFVSTLKGLKGPVDRQNHIRTHMNNPEFITHLKHVDPSGALHKKMMGHLDAGAALGAGTGVKAKAESITQTGATMIDRKNFKRLAGLTENWENVTDLSQARAASTNARNTPHPIDVLRNPIDQPVASRTSAMDTNVTMDPMHPETSSGFLDEVRRMADEARDMASALNTRMNLVARNDPRVEPGHVGDVRVAFDHAKLALEKLVAVCHASESEHKRVTNPTNYTPMATDAQGMPAAGLTKSHESKTPETSKVVTEQKKFFGKLW